MELKGSCHCGRVRFRLRSIHPYPFNVCYCAICRKTAGGGGYAIALGGDYKTLKVEGAEHIHVYNARTVNPETGELEESPGERHFCKECASVLWLWDPRWPELVHPFASAIDTDLPLPPERTHMMVASKANWAEVRAGPRDRTFDEYPEESLAQWHQRLGLEDRDG